MRRQQIREAAALWVVRLSAAPDAAEREAFEQWRSADLEHDIAFEQEALAWMRLDRLGALRPGQAEPDPDLLAPATRGRADRPPRRPWLALAASLAVTVVVGSSAIVSLPSGPAYATAVGERRTVRLADGTVVELNTDSRIVVRYNGHARTVRLLRGEAVFNVVQERRPFLVQTRAARVDAQHADLSVRLAGSVVRVSVRTGLVLAEPLDSTITATALGPGSLAVLGSGGATVQTVSTDEIDRRLAWRHGGIALNGEALADAVDEFNRYSVRKIRIGDPSIAAFHVGGYFDIRDVEGFADAVTRTFPVSINLSDDGTMVLRRRPRALSLRTATS